MKFIESHFVCVQLNALLPIPTMKISHNIGTNACSSAPQQAAYVVKGKLAIKLVTIESLKFTRCQEWFICFIKCRD